MFFSLKKNSNSPWSLCPPDPVHFAMTECTRSTENLQYEQSFLLFKCSTTFSKRFDQIVNFRNLEKKKL